MPRCELAERLAHLRHVSEKSVMGIGHLERGIEQFGGRESLVCLRSTPIAILMLLVLVSLHARVVRLLVNEISLHFWRLLHCSHQVCSGVGNRIETLRLF